MTFVKLSHSNSDPGDRHHTSKRPRFNSHVTGDRLRESSNIPPFSMVSNIRKGRRSIFKEVGLSEEEGDGQRTSNSHSREREFGEITGLGSEPMKQSEQKAPAEGSSSKGRSSWLSKLAPIRRPEIKSTASAPPPTTVSLQRLSVIALLIAVVLPALSYSNGRQTIQTSGADAGLIRPARQTVHETREASLMDVCTRWSGQSAILNGTLYYYGGRSKTSGDQQTDTWNNDFIALDLTKSWDISAPALSGLAQPSGPPAVSLGYLWNDLDRLFLYGGEFSDSPAAQPSPVSTWMYDVASSTWSEFQDPQTSAGNFSDPAGSPVQRAAEGAGISVPELGVSWYFGGHLDWATTPGWSNQVARVYLKSLLEFTHPGYANSGVDSLRASGAPEGGAYRNITWGGIQNQDGFSERADGVLVYVPGWGPRGILLGLGGGVVSDDETADAFSSMSTIDVYDIATSTWYHQATTGAAPRVRVNPCAVVFSAADASSFNVYLYGGQDLLPYGNQTQYADVWILTVPAFVWVKAGSLGGTQPPARAGHQCAARDGQMVVVGGYVGTEIACDSPGIYAFDASTLSWSSKFAAADHPADAHPENGVLAGSFGYRVPAAVQSVVGGSSDGGATATQPASGPATDGPFKTGTAPVFTITQAASTATVTGSSGGGGGGSPGDDGAAAAAGGPNPGTITAAVIAGLAGVLALYLGFCAWLYRRQVKAYKRHMAVANRYSGAGTDDVGGFIGGREKLRKSDPSDTTGPGERFAWVGPGRAEQPKWLAGRSSDEPSSGSSGPRPSPDYQSSPTWGAYDGGYGGGVGRSKSGASRSTASGGSAEALLDGREPNFFSVVLGPRRALKVVNGMED
ncbi:hypothetical protein F5B20DRAFT_596799 [Whalleya microplaca]|nr:hypothetical protein F5B20DRAFT_596799 [Whalleya microplaca]